MLELGLRATLSEGEIAEGLAGLLCDGNEGKATGPALIRAMATLLLDRARVRLAKRRDVRIVLEGVKRVEG